ncbi:hypothetical protein GCM10027449_24340 [Sinomonas notoginsengisoli]|uniref:hypothetical protein n=1 Tax=Sinomonas notoginsengisoli TaxID=1457311 RepID=UPI001F2D3900|nr:hypothetical protein [Sinomonas notoginsengisoli]
MSARKRRSPARIVLVLVVVAVVLAVTSHLQAALWVAGGAGVYAAVEWILARSLRGR